MVNSIHRILGVFVVVAVIGCGGGSGGSGQNSKSILDRADEQRAQVQINQLAPSLQLFQLYERVFPDSLEELIGGKYGVKKRQLKDPWHRDFIYSTKRGSKSFTLCSAGADKKAGSGDDICFK